MRLARSKSLPVIPPASCVDRLGVTRLPPSRETGQPSPDGRGIQLGHALSSPFRMSLRLQAFPATLLRGGRIVHPGPGITKCPGPAGTDRSLGFWFDRPWVLWYSSRLIILTIGQDALGAARCGVRELAGMTEHSTQGIPLRSRDLHEPLERTAHRALLHVVGVRHADMGKPLVAIVNSWNEVVPGHIHLRALGELVKQGVREAGGLPALMQEMQDVLHLDVATVTGKTLRENIAGATVTNREISSGPSPIPCTLREAWPSCGATWRPTARS